MFAHHNRIISVIYLIADLVLALLSFVAAHWVRVAVISPRALIPLVQYFWIVPLSVSVWLGAGLVTGIYREIHEEQLSRAFLDPLKVFFSGTLVLFALTFALRREDVSRLLLGFYALVDLGAMVCFRLVARQVGDPLRRAVSGLRQFLLVGETPEALEIARLIEAHENRGMRLFGFVKVGDAQPEELLVSPPAQHLLRRAYPLYSLRQIPELLRRQVIDEVIFAVSKEEVEKLEETFLLCEEEGVKARVLLSFFPHVISKVQLERLQQMPLLTFSTTPENEGLLLAKRVGDSVMALALLVVLSPLLLLLALLVKLTSPGPVLYRQTRCGLGGRPFTLFKFRSMREGADLEREELESLNEMDGPVFKIRKDPRLTALGRFLRRFSLDELPQLVNILKGDMSFVGPRPPLPAEVEKYERWQRRRLRMHPGLTCLWALEGRNRLTFQRWMELDLQYIDNWSPSLDFKILLKTIPVVLLGRGAS